MDSKKQESSPPTSPPPSDHSKGILSGDSNDLLKAFREDAVSEHDRLKKVYGSDYPYNGGHCHQKPTK